MSDGSVRIVGFVSREVALRLRSDQRQKGFRLTLFNLAWPSADYLVALPLTSIAVLLDQRLIRTDVKEPSLARAMDLELR